MKNKIDSDYALHNGNINDLKKKYDSELLALRKNIDEFKNTLLNDKNKISLDSTEQLNLLSKKIDDEILKLNEKNTLIVHPLKEGITCFTIKKNNKENHLFTVRVEPNKTHIQDIEGFDILAIDIPPHEEELLLDLPPFEKFRTGGDL